MIAPEGFDATKQLLDRSYSEYACKLFIDNDPVQIPHRFTNSTDIEISGLLAATIAWGNRKSIIGSMDRLIAIMGNSPHEFVTNFTPADSKYLDGFAHRTFNSTDAVAFIGALKNIYLNHGGLRKVFADGYSRSGSVTGAISHYRNIFTSGSFAQRSTKHIPDIDKGSAAKRLNMYLRWMVRPSTEGVDFGIWSEIPTSALLIPLDVHASRVARKLGLLERKQNDMRAVVELTDELKRFDPADPVKYDFALFGLGVYGLF